MTHPFHPPVDRPPRRKRLSDRLMNIVVGTALCWTALMGIGLVAKLAWYLSKPEQLICPN